MLRSDLEVYAEDLLLVKYWILAQINLVHTNTMNIMLTVNPITVITKFTAEDVIFFSQFFSKIATLPSNRQPNNQISKKIPNLVLLLPFKQILQYPTCKITRKIKIPTPPFVTRKKKKIPLCNIFFNFPKNWPSPH